MTVEPSEEVMLQEVMSLAIRKYRELIEEGKTEAEAQVRLMASVDAA